MPREDKYKAWDKHNKIWLGPYTLKQLADEDQFGYDREVHAVCSKWECFDWVKYTGFKDRKLQEIYESDLIVRPSIGIPMLVRWNEKEARFDLSLDPTNFDVAVLWYTQACQDDYEIVGNIYEHPEILSKVLKELNRV